MLNLLAAFISIQNTVDQHSTNVDQVTALLSSYVDFRFEPDLDTNRSGHLFDLQKYISYFQNHQFHLLYQGSHAFMFCPEIWPDELFDEKTNLLQNTLNSVNSDGVIPDASTKGFPFLLDRLDIRHRDSGTLQPDVVVRLQTMLTAKSAGKSFRVFISQGDMMKSNRKVNYDLFRGNSAMIILNPRSVKVTPVDVWESKDFTDHGLEDNRAEDLQFAMHLLSEHTKPLVAKFRSTEDALSLKLYGRNVGDIENVKFSDASKAIQDSVRQQEKNNWELFGFASRADGEKFLETARVTTHSTFVIYGGFGQTRFEVPINPLF